jgi:hypothetical protein
MLGASFGNLGSRASLGSSTRIGQTASPSGSAGSEGALLKLPPIKAKKSKEKSTVKKVVLVEKAKSKSTYF